MKKRILAAVLSLLLLCGCAPATSQSRDRIKVVATVFPLYDFVRAVGGDEVEITLLIDAGMEAHSFDPVPSDIRALQNADLILWVGGESECWAERLLKDYNGKTLKCMDEVALFKEEEHHEHDHHSHKHEAFDEHVWTSTENACVLVDAVCRELSKKSPKNAEIFAQNAADYKAQIEGVKKEIEKTVQSAENPFLLVADRFPFRYFAEEFSIPYQAAFGGCAASHDISIHTMAELVAAVREHGCTAAYYTELSNRVVAHALREETGVELFELHSAHNVTKEDFENGVTYVDLMRRNAENLKKGFCG